MDTNKQIGALRKSAHRSKTRRNNRIKRLKWKSSKRKKGNIMSEENKDFTKQLQDKYNKLEDEIFCNLSFCLVKVMFGFNIITGILLFLLSVIMLLEIMSKTF